MLADRPILASALYIEFKETSSYWSIQFSFVFHLSPFVVYIYRKGPNGPYYRVGPECAGHAYLHYLVLYHLFVHPVNTDNNFETNAKSWSVASLCKNVNEVFDIVGIFEATKQ